MTQVTSLALEQSHFVEADPSLVTEANLTEWWDLETIGIRDSPYDTPDEMALAKFNDTIHFENHRYFVSWPWKDNMDSLPTNYSLSLGRLNSLIRRFKMDPDLLQKYDEIIRLQVEQGIIEKVPTNENLGTKKHYLPHHPVITPDRSTTKVRIVYDGSAKVNKDSPSLNECMHRGPVILDDLCSLLIRFRLHRSALIADIEKAFLQIGLHPTERDVTRFLWMQDPKKLTVHNNLQIYRFARVPFGIISSPFLLGATISHHLSLDGRPTALRIQKDIYVDNVITGTSSTEDAIQFHLEAKELLQSASMNLREWLSNDPVVMESIPEHDRMKKTITKVLGLKWDTKRDTLSMVNPVPSIESTTTITKRHILQSIAKHFDPLGLWSPVLVKAKLFLQALWSENHAWDSPIGEDKAATWKQILIDLSPVTSLTISRFIGLNSTNEETSYELHCFADASKKAYGACVYLRISMKSNTSVHLLFAKSRVTPVREITLPRLELLAMSIGGRLLKFVDKSTDLSIKNRYLWTDSQCVLHWIQSKKPLSIFVTNRVKELRTMNNVIFRYVSTDQNPADLASRGTTVNDLQSSNLWWNGPVWLAEKESHWPKVTDQFCIDPEILKKITSEEKKSVIFETSLITGEAEITREAPFGIDPTRISSLTKLLRVTAWCIRFCQQLKSQVTKKGVPKSTLDAKELNAAKVLWVKYVQSKHYANVFEVTKGKTRNPIQQNFSLWSDENGLLRINSRLINANLERDATCPILLPKKDWFTKLVIKSYHERLFHSGVAHTLSQIRHEFWIPAGRSQVFQVVKSCQKCKRIDGGPYQPPRMPPLPKERVMESAPFTFMGLDYLGPLYIKTGGNQKKVWICLFTCMATRAIHLEVVEDLTAEQFLLALRRFIARRGKPDSIISDNAKQFKLAKSAVEKLWMKVIQSETVTSYVSQNGIQWTFIPERAPWMGGFYERLVQSVKRALRKSVQNITLTMIQLETLITEIESMINSRPLTHVGSSLNDGQALTPGHFLSLNPKTGVPPMELEDQDPEYLEKISSKEVLLKSWAKGERHLKMFWNTWRNEYLLNLHERRQTQLKRPRSAVHQSPKAGDIVHVRTESSRGSWPLAKIIQVITSADGEIRSAKIRLPSGTILTRAIVHLYPLELIYNQEDQSNNSKGDHDVPNGIERTNLEEKKERHASKLAKQKIKDMLKESEEDEEPCPKPNSGRKSNTLFNPSMLLMALCFLVAVLQPAASLQPLLCEKGNAKIALNLSGTYDCQFDQKSMNLGKVYYAKIAIYKRNIMKYDSVAYKCSKVKTIVEAYTNFAKAGWEERHRDEQLAITESECWSMIQNRRCREGPLLGGETTAFTENKVDPPYTTGNAWDCCKWYAKETVNCFLIKGKVYQSYHGQMESNLANVANCQYEKEDCILYDQSMLVWKANKSTNCEFVPWKKVEGKLWGNQFLSNDYELAFTWNGDQTKIEICDQQQAIMTDQGLPIIVTLISTTVTDKVNRPKRQNENSPTGENEAIAPRLQALELRWEEFTKESLNQAFYSVCRTIRELQQINLLLAHAEPTLIARKLINDSNVMGRLHGTVLEIWPCNSLQSYSFLAMGNRCTEWLPINYTVQGQPSFGYMDPKSRIIYANSAPTECDLVQETYFSDENERVHIYLAASGEIRSYHGSLVNQPLHTATMSTYIDFKPTIHKPIQMYTLKELRGQISLNDILASVESHATILKELSQVVEKPTSSQAKAILETASRYTPMGLMNLLTSKIHWIWVQTCCVYVSFQIIWKIFKHVMKKALRNRRNPVEQKVVDISDSRGSNSITMSVEPTQHQATPKKSSILAVIEAMKNEE